MEELVGSLEVEVCIEGACIEGALIIKINNFVP